MTEHNLMAQMATALEALLREQDGPPLVRRVSQYRAAMKLAHAALAAYRGETETATELALSTLTALQQERDELQAALEWIAGGDVMRSEVGTDKTYSHADTVLAYQGIARAALAPKATQEAGALSATDDAWIKALYVERHGDDEGWLDAPGSYFISGVQAALTAQSKLQEGK